ncbi:hypothetical protein GCM10010335_30280 [Streptomyces galbus]|nr:hypothetical protein GCM10010335_30280 [Streptomyces galbus]
MSSDSTSSRMARSAAREAARWERSRERGSSADRSVDKGVPPGLRDVMAVGRPVSVRSAALREGGGQERRF